MAGSLLLDTSFVIALFARDSDAERVVAAASELYLPSIALGELLYGAEHSTRRAENLAQVEEFAASAAILPCDAETAWYYGEIKSSLRRRAGRFPTTTSGSPRSPGSTGSRSRRGMHTSGRFLVWCWFPDCTSRRGTESSLCASA